MLSLAVAAPAAAASLGALRVDLLTPALGADGYPIDIRDGKFLNNSNTNTSRTNTSPVIATFQVRDTATNLPVPGATCIVDCGNQRDAEGNYLLGAVAWNLTGNIDQSTTKRIRTEVTDANGQIRVKLATATWAQTDCLPGAKGALVPVSGTLTVLASATGYAAATAPFPYLVYDGAPLVTCG